MTSKKTYVSDETFAELIESAEQALQYERGAREGYRVTRVAIPKPPRPRSSGNAGSNSHNLP